MKQHQLLLIAVLTALAFLIAACGGNPPPQQTATLNLTIDGDGAGTVSFDPAGTPAAECTDDCTKTFSRGATVTLTATPAEGSTVTWGGACSAATGATCSVTMDGNKAVTATFAADAQNPGVSGVTIPEGDQTLAPGDTAQLTATVTVTGGAATTVTWSSDNEAVATVSDTGLVTAVAEGTANITATSTADATKKASVVVTVSSSAQPVVNSVTINEGETSSLAVGLTQQLTATVNATGGAATTVTWSSDNEAVATVSDTGLVTAVAEGTANITATSTADATKSDVIAITVTASNSTCPGGQNCVQLSFRGSGTGNVFVNGTGPYTADATVPVSTETAIIQTNNGTVVAWGDACGTVRNSTRCDVKMNGSNQKVSVAFSSGNEQPASSTVSNAGLPGGSSDDAEEFIEGIDPTFPAGTVRMDSSTLELTYDPRGSNQLVGLRFRNLNIPQGAVILDAYIQFRAREVSSDDPGVEPLVLTIEAQDSANAPTFVDIQRNISSTTQRPRLGTSVTWQPKAWTGTTAGPNQQTPNLHPILSQLVSKPSWDPANNAVVFIVSNNGSINRRAAESVEGNSAGAAQLVVVYEPPATP